MILIKFSWGTKLYFRQRDLRVEHIITNAWFHFCYFQIEKDQERERCVECEGESHFQQSSKFISSLIVFHLTFPLCCLSHLTPCHLITLLRCSTTRVSDEQLLAENSASPGGRTQYDFSDQIWARDREREPPDVPHRREELLATRSSTWVLWWWARLIKGCCLGATDWW